MTDHRHQFVSNFSANHHHHPPPSLPLLKESIQQEIPTTVKESQHRCCLELFRHRGRMKEFSSLEGHVKVSQWRGVTV
jgi:hypothetical protein